MGDKGVVPERDHGKPEWGSASLRTLPLFLAVAALLLSGIVPTNFMVSGEDEPLADNLPPVAHAGEDISSVLLNDLVVLNGSASTDEDIDNCTWEWTSTSHPFIVLSDPNSSSPSFINPVEQEDTITFVLTLTDPSGLNSTDDVQVLVEENRDPVARIQLPMPSGDPFIEGTVLEFTANGTSDPETSPDELTYIWSSNVSGQLSDRMFFHMALYGLGWHTISLNVSDPNGGWDVDEVEIYIREEPMAPSAGINKLILKRYPNKFYQKGETIPLDGSRSSDPNIRDELNLTWMTNQTGGQTLGYGERINVTLDEGIHNITLTVTDLDGLTSVDWVLVEVRNRPPVAIIRGPEIVNVSETATFGTALSYDPDGDDLEFTWYFEDGDVQTGAAASRSWLYWGTYNVTLVVDDGSRSDALANETVRIIVNAPPVADGGGDRTVTVDEYFTLNANMSHDEDGAPSPLSYRWDLDDDGLWDEGLTRKEERILFAKEGEYPIVLEVSDGWATSVDVFVITALIPNEAPIAIGGPDLVVTLDGGQGEAELDASRSYDPDDDINGDGKIGEEERDNLTYTWDLDHEKDSDGDGNFTNDRDRKGKTVRFTVSDTEVIIVTLKVSDKRGKWSADTVRVRGNNKPEISGISIVPSSVYVLTGAEISFTANARDIDRKDVLNYTWDMGDGRIKTGSRITHRYYSEQTFTVTLTVDDGYSEVVDSSTMLSVEEFEAPTITDPREGGEVSGTYTIRGKAKGAAMLPLESVEISIDGNPYRGASRVKSDWTTWSFDLDTAALVNGEHTIEVRAVIRDGSVEHISNVTSMSIMVNNQPSSSMGGSVGYIAAFIIAVVFIILIFIFLKRRNRQMQGAPPPGMPAIAPPPGMGNTGPFLPPAPAEADNLPPAPEQQPAPGEEEPGDRLRIRCPACRKIFITDDSGERPLKLTCSHCGANGMIESAPGEEEKEGEKEEEEEEEGNSVPIVCPNCTGLFELDQVMDSAICPFCGVDGELDDATIDLLEERFGKAEKISIKCPRCEFRFEVSKESDEITCPRCGATGKI